MLGRLWMNLQMRLRNLESNFSSQETRIHLEGKRYKSSLYVLQG